MKGVPGSKAHSESSSKHRRSRTGCLTCRKRKKRCDELRPCCKTCQRLALSCVYPKMDDTDRKGRNKLRPRSDGLVPSLSDLSSDDAPLQQPTHVAKMSSCFEMSDSNVSTSSYALDILRGPVEAVSTSCMNGQSGLAVDEPEAILTDPKSSSTQFHAYAVSGRPDVLSPPSLEQEIDYFKSFKAPALNHDSYGIGSLGPMKDAGAILKEEYLMKQAELAMLPILSAESPFLAMGQPPLHLDTLCLHHQPVVTDDIQPPTSEEFHEIYPDLDATAFELLEHFQSQQSHIRSASPLKRFRAVALLFSLRSRTNLLGILSWAAWHRGSANVAQKYFQVASERLALDASLSKEELLVALLVLTSAKISSGKSDSWPAYLQWASNILQKHGGVSSFMESETLRWLLLHFAYLDILSVTSSTTPKLLSAGDLEFIFKRSPSPTLSDSLCSCCEPLLLMIEQVNELSKSMRQSHASGENLETLYNRAHHIEEKTWALQPATDKIIHLSEPEQRLQIRQFDAFKLVTVLHLYQSALCMNAAATPIQVLARRLFQALEELIESNVAGMLVFPLFILGVNSSNASMRQQLLRNFDRVFRLIRTRSVERVKNLLLEVWQLDQSGSRHVDWTELIDQKFDFRCG